MDNEQVHYLTYDPDAIWLKAVEAYVAAGGDVLYPGDAKEMLLRAVQSIVMQTLAGADAALLQATLKNAIGPYLDLYAQRQRLGCVRLPAEKAECKVRITFTGSAPITIPAGSTLTADGEIIYELKEDAEYLSETIPETVCSIVCTEAGAAGNGLIAGTQLMFTTPVAGVMSIFAASDASGGRESEADDAYRERIHAYGLASVTTGPAVQYENAARAVSGDILDVKAKRIEAGVVGIYLLICDGGDAETLIGLVEERLKTKDSRPLTDAISVVVAEKLSYSLKVTYAHEPGSEISEKVASAVEKYQAWQDNQLGLAFNPDKLKAMIYEAGATRVVFGEDSAFDGGEIEYTTISDTQYLTGSVDVAVISG